MISRFTKEFGFIFLVRLVGALASLVMTYAVATMLPPNEAGNFFLAFTILTVIGMLSTLGYTTSFVRFIGGSYATQNWAVMNSVFWTGIKISLSFSIFLSAALFFMSSYIANLFLNDLGMESLIQSLAIIIPFFALYQLIGFAFQGLHKSKISTFFCHILSPFLFIIIIAFFHLIQEPLNTAQNTMNIFAIASILTAIFGIFFWYSQEITKVAADHSENSQLVRSAIPVWCAMSMTMVVQWGSQIISGMYLLSDELAVLFVALRFSLLTTFILIAINLYAAPRFAASAKTNKKDEIRSTSIMCSRVMFTAATPIVLILFFGAEFFMSLFGEEYIIGSNILRILVVGQYVNVITGSVAFLLNMTGHEKDMRNVVFFSGPLAIILGLLLIPSYGLTGAASSTAIAVASQNLLAAVFVKKRLGFNTLNFFSNNKS